MSQLIDTININRQKWRDLVINTLGKFKHTKSINELKEPEQLLESQTYEGFKTHPIYTSLNSISEFQLPGKWPFVRGNEVLRGSQFGWKVAESFPSVENTKADVINSEIISSMNSGTSALILHTGKEGDIRLSELDCVLKNVFLDLVPVIFEINPNTCISANCDALIHITKSLELEKISQLSIDLGADPITALLFESSNDIGWDLLKTINKLSKYHGKIRAITVNGPSFHDIGANASWELASSLAVAVSYVRLLVDNGFSPYEALKQISYRYAVDNDQFMTIAKLRAGRQLWARIAEIIGYPTSGSMTIHAVTSTPMMTQRDPWINLLRTTLAAFAAGVGGANTIKVNQFDMAISKGFKDVSLEFSRRIARNIQLLLLEEANVGHVSDPAGGSWFVEDLTNRLARQTWIHFQDIEDKGGFIEAREYIISQITKVATIRSKNISHRRSLITGVNEFPNLQEPPLQKYKSFFSVTRYAEKFELLRNRSDDFFVITKNRPNILLLPIGNFSENKIIITFILNLLAVGGIEVINSEISNIDNIYNTVFNFDRTHVAVICGNISKYATEMSNIVIAAHATGVNRVLVAGSQNATSKIDIKPDGYLNANMDAASFLSDLLTSLGA